MNETDPRLAGPLLRMVTVEEPGDNVSCPRWRAGHETDVGASEGTPSTLAVSAIRLQESVGDAYVELVDLRGVPAQLVITDRRIVLTCRRTGSKGGGWWGFGGLGIAVAVIANSVSKARAAARERKMAVVGHVWFDHLDSLHHVALPHGDVLRIQTRRDGGALWLDLTLPRDLDGARVAQQICRRAAQHRLTAAQPHQVAHLQRLTELTASRLGDDQPVTFDSDGARSAP